MNEWLNLCTKAIIEIDNFLLAGKDAICDSLTPKADTAYEIEGSVADRCDVSWADFIVAILSISPDFACN